MPTHWPHAQMEWRPPNLLRAPEGSPRWSEGSVQAQVSWLWVMPWGPHAPQTVQKEFSPLRNVCSAPGHAKGFTARPLLPDFHL